MIASLIAAAYFARASAVILVTPRPEGMSAPTWDLIVEGARSVAEDSLSRIGYRIADPKGLPSFDPKGNTRAQLKFALQESNAVIAIAIHVAGLQVRTVPDISAGTMKEASLKRVIPERDDCRKNSAEVTLKVWLMEYGAEQPFIDGKTPTKCLSDWVEPGRLVGDAAGIAMEDVLRRFLRMRGS